LTTGISYDLNKTMSIDASYLAMLGLRRTVDNNVSEADNAILFNSTMDGRYFSFYQVAVLTVRMKWEGFFESLARKSAGEASVENASVTN